MNVVAHCILGGGKRCVWAMDDLAAGTVKFCIHAPVNNSDEVSALVFGEKLTLLVRALRAADKAVNGRTAHKYNIARLQSSTPTVFLAERPASDLPDLMPSQSGIRAFDDCVSAITFGDRERALSYGSCAKQVSKLARGAEKNFSYGEVWTGGNEIVRVDALLVDRARKIVEPVMDLPPEAQQIWYQGTAHGSFVGEIDVVDLRGALPQIMLTLSAGGKRIDCVCRSDQVEKIGENLKKRVRIYGYAMYDGSAGLPQRVEVTDIEPMPTATDITQWKGAFEAVDLTDWETDDL